ncbi:MAG: penicillin acylase family protein [Acidovorax sp.]
MVLISCLYAGSAAAASGVEPDPSAGAGKVVEIRRTADDIPHIRARSWAALGEGIGYAQAEDALCTLADGFLTYSGERSRFHGADSKPATDSTFGRSSNLELDFFFRGIADERTIYQYRKAQPHEFEDLAAGYASGFNRYLAHARRARGTRVAHVCLHEPWVRPITALDVYRRLFAAAVAGGYARFVKEIANAHPPGDPRGSAFLTGSRDKPGELEDRLARSIGDQDGLGSNAIALGGRATAGDGAVLFGNPHWYWAGPDRFYQLHLTIPGKLDVAGATFLGLPFVLIGFNDHVAWSHTVSTSRRFGLFELALDEKDPTQYRMDGRYEQMQRVPIVVEVRERDGSIRKVARTLYRSRHGPIVDLGARDPSLGWGRARALAIRDINEGNTRLFRNYLRWAQARSLDEFVAIQRQEEATPWVNTVAIGQGDQRVWFADVGAVPNTSDAFRKACASALTVPFARVDARTPLVDGSRTACEWPSSAAPVQAGAMPQERLPQLLRDDYVANMNDSYWLTNPNQPLEGLDSVLGGERKALSLRGREGHRLANSLLHGRFSSARDLARQMMSSVLEGRAYSADEYKTRLLEVACVPQAAPEHGMASGAAGENFDLRQACDVLANWSNRAGSGDRGALLWEAFWGRLSDAKGQRLFDESFDPANAMNTPGIRMPSEEQVRKALVDAARSLEERGLGLDAPVGLSRFVRAEGRRWSLYGGCGSSGYFTVVCDQPGSSGSEPVFHGASHLQIVFFNEHGVQPYTLLAHGERERALSGGEGGEPVVRFTRQEWLRFPFHEDEIATHVTRRLVLPLR